MEVKWIAFPIANIPVLVELAESIGLKGAEEVLSSWAFKEAVDRDWKYSRACKVTAVPTFVASGRRLVGAQPYNALEELISDEKCCRSVRPVNS